MEDKQVVSGGIPTSSGSTNTPTAKPVVTPKATTTPAGAVRQTPTTLTKPPVGQTNPAVPQARPVRPVRPATPQVRPATPVAPVKPSAVDPKTALRRQILNNIVQRRIGETKQSIFKQLGIQNAEQLQELLGKVKSYEDLNSKFYNINTELTTLKAEKVATSSGVKPEKVDDLLTYLKGKGLEYTAENIQQAVATHPEWIVNQQQAQVRPATIGKVGQQTQPVVSDIQQTRNLFPSLRKK
jgi:hypothetical protein